ncbi:ferrous iron transport protein A [Belliella sp. DSM 111904]|uniref:Ferrous iron transport protein A n=1 Tax=Belliella filtrata TaxID=2923435 RepID=A0ABS9V057_9BACT|nr:FeoA family protein [Belliella filtrata]MCH7409802.1 ferrous iron transport protein A [Belliella filtrata]
MSLSASNMPADIAHKIIKLDDSNIQINMMEMGLGIGKTIVRCHKAPFGGAIAFEIEGNMVCMRPSEAFLVKVEEIACDFKSEIDF